jgi:hypothetical protein
MVFAGARADIAVTIVVALAEALRLGAGQGTTSAVIARIVIGCRQDAGPE